MRYINYLLTFLLAYLLIYLLISRHSSTSKWRSCTPNSIPAPWQELESLTACGLYARQWPLESEPFASTAFAKCVFRCSAPATWNTLPRTVTENDSLGTFKSRLKTFLFSLAFNWHWHCPLPAPLKLWPNSAVQICYYYYDYYYIVQCADVDADTVRLTTSSRQTRFVHSSKTSGTYEWLNCAAASTFFSRVMLHMPR